MSHEKNVIKANGNASTLLKPMMILKLIALTLKLQLFCVHLGFAIVLSTILHVQDNGHAQMLPQQLGSIWGRDCCAFSKAVL